MWLQRCHYWAMFISVTHFSLFCLAQEAKQQQQQQPVTAASQAKVGLEEISSLPRTESSNDEFEYYYEYYDDEKNEVNTSEPLLKAAASVSFPLYGTPPGLTEMSVAPVRKGNLVYYSPQHHWSLAPPGSTTPPEPKQGEEGKEETHHGILVDATGPRGLFCPDCGQGEADADSTTRNSRAGQRRRRKRLRRRQQRKRPTSIYDKLVEEDPNSYFNLIGPPQNMLMRLVKPSEKPYANPTAAGLDPSSILGLTPTPTPQPVLLLTTAEPAEKRQRSKKAANTNRKPAISFVDSEGRRPSAGKRRKRHRNTLQQNFRQHEAEDGGAELFEEKVVPKREIRYLHPYHVPVPSTIPLIQYNPYGYQGSGGAGFATAAGGEIHARDKYLHYAKGFPKYSSHGSNYYGSHQPYANEIDIFKPSAPDPYLNRYYGGGAAGDIGVLKPISKAVKVPYSPPHYEYRQRPNYAVTTARPPVLRPVVETTIKPYIGGNAVPPGGYHPTTPAPKFPPHYGHDYYSPAAALHPKDIGGVPGYLSPAILAGGEDPTAFAGHFDDRGNGGGGSGFRDHAANVLAGYDKKMRIHEPNLGLGKEPLPSPTPVPVYVPTTTVKPVPLYKPPQRPLYDHAYTTTPLPATVLLPTEKNTIHTTSMGNRGLKAYKPHELLRPSYVTSHEEYYENTGPNPHHGINFLYSVGVDHGDGVSYVRHSGHDDYDRRRRR